MVPVSVISSIRAAVLLWKDRVFLLEEHPGVKIRTVDNEFPAPSLVCHKVYHNLPNYYYVPATLTLDNLKTRDRSTCQYCARTTEELGEREYWTKDHVMPISRGGENRWENVVLSCNTCNNKKADRTPEEADLTLLSAPKVPTRKLIDLLKKFSTPWKVEEE